MPAHQKRYDNFVISIAWSGMCTSHNYVSVVLVVGCSGELRPQLSVL